MSEINRIRVKENPPMRMYVIATTPGGKRFRWSEDESYADQVLENLVDSDTVPGGYNQLTGALARKPHIDYADLQRGTLIEVFGAGGYKISEYRLERAPRTAGSKLVVDPAAVGYQAHLTDDESAAEIFIDADLQAWGEPSTERKVTYKLQKFNTDGQVQIIPAGDPTGSSVPSLAHSFAQMNNNEGKEIDIAESWYRSPVELGQIMLDFVTIKGIGVGWHNGVYASADSVTTELLHDYEGSASVEHLNQAVSAGRFYLLLADYYAPTYAGAANSEVQWRNIRVLGRHGLTLHGTWPNLGVLASDVIAYVLPKWAPQLNFTTGAYGTIKPTSFPIPQLAFKEQTTAKAMIEEALKTEMLEWGVWDNRTFYLNPRGEREGRKRWRARVRPAQLEETGPQMDRVYNGCLVSFTLPGGETVVIGPPGSGCRYTSEKLLETDPTNPANELGIRRWKKIQAAGILSPEKAVEAGEYFLKQSRELDGSGSAKLTGYVEHESGAMYPYTYVRSGDLISFVDASDSSYRYIVEATRERQSRSVTIKLDAPPDTSAALSARQQDALIQLGLT